MLKLWFSGPRAWGLCGQSFDFSLCGERLKDWRNQGLCWFSECMKQENRKSGIGGGEWNCFVPEGGRGKFIVRTNNAVMLAYDFSLSVAEKKA